VIPADAPRGAYCWAVEVDGEADQVDRSVVGEEAVDGEGVHRQAGG
jgi:hypothetical protein